jgi:hypothetical protein
MGYPIRQVHVLASVRAEQLDAFCVWRPDLRVRESHATGICIAFRPVAGAADRHYLGLDVLCLECLLGVGLARVAERQCRNQNCGDDAQNQYCMLHSDFPFERTLLPDTDQVSR